MKNTFKLLLSTIIVFIAVLIFSNTRVQAATATLTSSKTVTQGDSVTVTANVTAGAWNLKLTGAGKSEGLVGQTSTTGNESASKSITFTASQVGTYEFKLTGDITDYNTEVTTDINQTCTITVKEPEQEKPVEEPEPPVTPTKSSNNQLKMLGIRPNDFYNFKPGTTTYYVTVPNDVTQVEVYAEKQESSQQISGTGYKSLKVGTNTLKVVCTAEDGTTKTYTMYVTREEEKVEEETPTEPEEPATEEPVEEEQPEENTDENTEGTEEKVLGITNLNIVGKNEKGETVGVELSPGFEENIYEYVLTVPLTVKDLEITADVENGTAEIEVMGNKNLIEGENSVTVIIKVGEETKVYQITVNKTAETVNTLSNEVITQLAIIAAIATIIIVAIVAIIIMIVKSKKKDKKSPKTHSNIDVNSDIQPTENTPENIDETNKKEE